MKTTLHRLAAAAALSAALIGSAHADQTVFVPLTYGSGLTLTGSFSDSFSAAASFTDTYIYANAPSFSLDQYMANASASAPGVTFSSVALYVFGDNTPVALTNAAGLTSIDTAPLQALASATYALVIQGAATAGSSYSGVINSTAVAAVPEPGTWAMMLAGGAVAVGLARRRRKA